MDKYSGKRLDGRYEIYEPVGSGGMAVVYRAYDTIDDRIVAIKILKDEYLGNAEFIRRFKNESKAIAVLSHPNIVKVYDVSFGDRIQYIVEEYIDGITLKDYLNQQTEVKWKEAIHFIVQILRALQHAHEKGVVHRDIKPQNIMLLQDGTIKVTDFGIARFSRSETRTMTDKAIGSVHYIAPEQARGDLTDEKTDIYSVGVMLYEMITGQLPFEADNAVSVAIMQLQNDPRPPKEINPSIPDGLEEITMKAMQKNPAQRYQSAAEMLRDIEEFKRNPSINFQYKYILDENPNKYVDAINNVKSEPQPIYNDNYVYEEDPEPKKKKQKPTYMWVITGILAAFLIVGIGFGMAAIFRSCNSGSEELKLPNFVGMKLEDIQNNSEYTDNFNFIFETKEDPTKDANVILSQTPSADTMVKKGSDVTLVVNSGSKMVTVPDVTDYTQAEAEAAMKEAGLPYRIETVADDTVEEGKVVRTNPKAGSSVPAGATTITILVSSGKEEEQVAVPSVIDKQLEAAKAEITAAGLKVGNVTAKDDTGKAAGVVIETNPLPGVKVNKDTAVDIVYSSGKTTEKTVSAYVNLPNNISHDIVLEAYLDNEKLINGKTVNPAYNRTYTINVTGTTGSKKLTVTLDGQTYNVFTVDFDKGRAELTEQYNYVDPNPSSSQSSSSNPSSETE